MPDLARELDAALAAARLASDYLRREYAAFTPVPDAPPDISTHADKGAQELILRHLHAAFPADGLLAEEATDTLHISGAGTSGRVWVVDPIDGTRGFAAKNDQFSVMIGLAVNGRAVIGLVAEPVSDRITYGVIGGGCWVWHGSGEAVGCRVSLVPLLEDVCLARSHSKPGRPTLGERLLRPRTTITTHSAGIKLALVARGEADVYVNDHAAYHDWDVCAGHALVEAAGGRVTGFAGQPVGYGPGGPRRTWGLVASNGLVHDAVVQKLATEG
jgi:3'(2'), 5'-bisphosphate nucleotidase